MVIIFEPGIAQGLKVESGIPQVLISEAGITLLFMFLRLEFLTGVLLKNMYHRQGVCGY